MSRRESKPGSKGKPPKKGNGGMRVLLTIALALALVIVVQFGLVYYKGKVAGDNASTLLAAFRKKTAEQNPGADIPPEDANAEQFSGAEFVESTVTTATQADILTASRAEEHRLSDGSAVQDEGGDYVQPDAPSVSEKEKIIAEIISKVGEDGIIGVIEIPEIEVELPVIGKWSYNLLDISVCRYTGPKANGEGNLVILGHNYKNGSHFGKLDKLKKGSEVFLTDLDSHKVRYVVYEVETIEPTAFAKLDAYRGKSGLTLVTCIDNGSHRQVFRCERQDA